MDACFGPAVHAGVNRVPVAKALGKTTPLTAMLGNIEDRIDHLKVGQADVATLPGQAVFNGGELFGRDVDAPEYPPLTTKSLLVLIRPSLSNGF